MAVAGIVVVVLLGGVMVCVVLALVRLHALRDGGVRVAVRLQVTPGGRGWRLGIGHYRGDEFLWYRPLGLVLRPEQVLGRSALSVENRRAPSDGEAYAMPNEASVLHCRGPFGDLELAMGSEALTGFLSWLEAAPPGRRATPWAS
jgi:hypothetical protein